MSGQELHSRSFTYVADCECTAEQLLLKSGISKRLIVALKQTENGLMINGARVRSTARLGPGERLVITMPEQRVRRAKAELDIPVVYEDEDIIVYDKPAGIACHRSGSHFDDTLENAADGVFRAVTRLDKDTSGLLLAAKHQLAAGRLWQHTEKRYIAVVQGAIAPLHGVIDLPIMREQPYEPRMIVDEYGAPALTEYTVLAQNERASAVKCTLHTGRTHQIRVHFSAVGHPLFGDAFYGGRTDIMPRQALHCGELMFSHPVTNQKLYFIAKMPMDMTELLASLGLDFSENSD